MQHNVTYLIEFANFTALDKFFTPTADPAFQTLMAQFDTIAEGHYHDVFIETPMP